MARVKHRRRDGSDPGTVHPPVDLAEIRLELPGIVAKHRAAWFAFDNLMEDATEIARERGVLIVGKVPDGLTFEHYHGVDSPRTGRKKPHT